MRKQRRKPGFLEREKILGDAIKCVAGELRLVDLSILVRSVTLEQHANIADLIASSSELFFVEGTLKYGSRADLGLNWGQMPSVVLDLEFSHMGVHVNFALTLKSFNACIDIHAISFDGPTRSPQENTALLKAALADARYDRTDHTAARIIAEEARAQELQAVLALQEVERRAESSLV
ncbi:MAG TPA: hypothetical protein VLQ65_03450 [Saliniramus sp.]|nr:hypothetical protein [Saliniramus sp.]